MSKKRLNTEWTIQQQLDDLRKRYEELADIQKTSDDNISVKNKFNVMSKRVNKPYRIIFTNPSTGIIDIEKYATLIEACTNISAIYGSMMSFYNQPLFFYDNKNNLVFYESVTIRRRTIIQNLIDKYQWLPF
jgi:hypothetical protein